MNKIAIIVLIGLFCSACENPKPTEETSVEALSTELVNNPRLENDSVDLSDAGRLVFPDSVHDFGKLKDGEIVQYDFEFSNQGTKDILITSAKGSCGCTVPTYDREPIKVGGKGKLTVTFDSHGRSGYNEKKIDVFTNGVPSQYVLTILSEVNK